MRSLKLRLEVGKKTAVYIQIMFVLVMLWLRDVLHFPSYISYLTDILLLIVIFSVFYKKKTFDIYTGAIPQYIIVALIFIFMVIGAIINAVEPLLVLWGMRNNLRFFLFFFMCIVLLDKSDIDCFIKLFKVFFWINFVMVLIQYFGFGLSGDYLGGFFGTARGCNGYLNVFLCIILSITLSEFFSGKIKFRIMLAYMILSLVVASFAELKIFYIELIMMVIVVIFLTKPSMKTIVISLTLIAIIVFGSIALFLYDPYSFNIFFDSDALEFYLSGNGYTNSGDFNRFTAISQIQTQFFGDNMFLTIFGFGLGNCEYSQFEFLRSDFSEMYGHLNYRWFTHAWVYLEQGIVGIILIVAFFVSLLVYAIKFARLKNSHYMVISIAFIPTCLIGLIYNVGIQVESCYLIALVCAIPYIINKSNDIRSL